MLWDALGYPQATNTQSQHQSTHDTLYSELRFPILVSWSVDNWPRMDSLPLEIYQQILGYVIEAEPIAHVVNTRLVNCTLTQIPPPNLKENSI